MSSVSVQDENQGEPALSSLGEQAETVEARLFTPARGAEESSAVEEQELSPEENFREEERPPSPVNYDEPGVLEVELDEVVYRFDAGKQGTALCLSRRSEGSWDWEFLGELRWDGRDLRSKALERKLLQSLSLLFRQFLEEQAN